MDNLNVSHLTRLYFAAFIFLLTCLGLSHTSIAADDSSGHLTDMVTPNGQADWTTGIVTAKGIGIPPKNTSSALQSREMTRTAAWSVALRNLLEVLNGVNVNSTTTVSNYVTLNDEIRTKVDGMVRKARVIKEQELPDGSFEMTVEMNLGGNFSQMLLPKTPPITEPLKRLDKTPPPPQPPKAFTGLVVDARGTGAVPALAPKLLTLQGEEAYGPSYVETFPSEGQRLEDKFRIAWYVTNDQTARTHQKVSSNPLMIKAIRAEGKNRTDLVIEDADAQLIQLVPAHFQFLKQAKVLIILDQK